MFIAIPATCFVSLTRRNVSVSRPIGLFLTASVTSGVAYVVYGLLFLFDPAHMRGAGITALILMFITIVMLLSLIPALVNIYDPERERLASIVESSQDAIVGKDIEGNITNWNPGAEALYGYSHDEAVGQHIRLIVPPQRYAELDEIMQHIQRGESVCNLETERRNKLGKQLVISLSISPMRDKAGQIIGASAIGRDITARRRAEQQLISSNKALDEFAYVASHDLKSPLRGIDNLCRFIEEDLGEGANATVTDHLRQLRGRVRRMEKLLDDLLEYSRVGRGAQRIQTLRVANLIDNIVHLLDVPPGIDVRIEGELPVIDTWATPLEQVFRNLIHNAIKHHDRTQGRISIASKTLGHLIEFSVMDDGPGIEPQFRERIFRIFTTLQSRDKLEGSGIGLSLVEKVTRHYGGNVWLDGYSDGERGAIFKFTWPYSVREEPL